MEKVCRYSHDDQLRVGRPQSKPNGGAIPSKSSDAVAESTTRVIILDSFCVSPRHWPKLAQQSSQPSAQGLDAHHEIGAPAHHRLVLLGRVSSTKPSWHLYTPDEGHRETSKARKKTSKTPPPDTCSRQSHRLNKKRRDNSAVKGVQPGMSAKSSR